MHPLTSTLNYSGEYNINITRPTCSSKSGRLPHLCTEVTDTIGIHMFLHRSDLKRGQGINQLLLYQLSDVWIHVLQLVSGVPTPCLSGQRYEQSGDLLNRVKSVVYVLLTDMYIHLRLDIVN